MTIRIDIPPEHEAALRAAWGASLDQFAFEALVIEGYRSGRFSASEVGRFLRLADRWAVNKWLADRKVPLNYTIDDLESDRQTLDRVLGKSA